MTRRLKTAGVLTAVVAMFALSASAAQAQFTSEKYPATISGTSTNDMWDFPVASTAKCKDTFFAGTLSATSNTLTITPTYTNCTAFGLPATVNMTSCRFVFHTDAPAADTVDVDCNTGDAIDITAYTASDHKIAICHVKVPEQFGKVGFNFTNNTNGTVTISGVVANLTASQVRTNAVLCPPWTHTPPNEPAIYTIQAGGIGLAGNNGAIFFD